ncbi:MAG: hypothetical protein NDJ94_15310 [Vicinamibacteria bacterium]|nr:hypothetical protein [Vicinamibacteria bacterium]
MSSPVGLAAYLLLAVASLQPQMARPADTIAYVGDSLESVYIVARNVHQVFSDPLRLFEANVLHPLPGALALTDHRLLPSLLAAPAIWATGNAVLGYNLALVVVLVFCAWAGRRLASALALSPLAAWAAGAVYAFHTYQVHEAPRLNIVAHGFLPLALLELLALLRGGGRRHAWRCAAFMLLQGLSSNYHLLYGALLLGLVLVLFAVARPRETLRATPPLLAAAAVAALCFAPVAWPYVQVARSQGLTRALPEGVDLRHYVSTSPKNVWYGAVGAEVRLQQKGPHFTGFLALGLAVVACAAALRRRDVAVAVSPLLPARAWIGGAALLALLFVALSLGRDVVVWGRELGPGPYRLLFDYVPGFRLVRIPERLSLLAMLFVALLAGRGLDLVRSAVRGRVAAGAGAVLALALPLEHLSLLPVSEQVPAGRRLPAVYDWLRTAPVRAYAEVPVRGEALVRQETLEMYFSTASWKPVIHGYTAYPPLVTRVLRRLLLRFPSEATLAGLERVGVDAVVVHEGRPLGIDVMNQLSTRGADSAAERERLLALTGQDLHARLPAALAARRIERLVRFEGPAGRLFQSDADVVYRVLPGPRPAPATFPTGRVMREAGWRYRAKAGQPELAADGDPRTVWQVPRRLRGDEFYEVTFDRPRAVAGLVLRLQQGSAWPTRFKVGARAADGHWSDAGFFDDAHELQLLDTLLRDPRAAAIGFDLGGREVTGLILQLLEGGTSEDGWNIPEIEVLVR